MSQAFMTLHDIFMASAAEMFQQANQLETPWEATQLNGRLTGYEGLTPNDEIVFLRALALNLATEAGTFLVPA